MSLRTLNDKDPYRNAWSHADSPNSSFAVAVTPHNATMLDRCSKELWVGGAGNVTVLMVSGETVTFTSVPAGTRLPIRVQRVNATGTTATNIVALS